MEPLCHRCGSTLDSQEPFCPTCGAPQLRLAEGSEDGGEQPADRALRALHPENVTWRNAVAVAISVALPVGILSSQIIPALSGACCLWGIGGSVAAVALYRRRNSGGPLDVATGMRLGLIVGLLASFCSSAANATLLLAQRFAFHNGASLDKNWQTQMEQASLATAQLFPQLPQQAAQTSMHFWLTPDGRAAGVILNAVLFSAGMLLFSTIGGALGARIFAARAAAR